MSKKLKLIILAIALILLAVFFTYNHIMHGGERNLTTEKTDFTVTSAPIISEFTTNIELANSKYLEKAVAVKGEITSCDGNQVILDKLIVCSFQNQDASLKKGQAVTIKGRVVGYDDLMGELKLDQCFVIKK